MNPRIVSLKKINALFLLVILLMLIYVSPSNAEILTNDKGNDNTIEVKNAPPMDFFGDLSIRSTFPLNPITLESSSSNSSGITWLNNTVIESTQQSETPSIAVDNKNITHLCWSNYNGGGFLYHAMIYENGTFDTFLIESHIGG